MTQLNVKKRILIINRPKLALLLLSCAFVLLNVTNANAAANFVYHEQTSNFVATPTCPNGGTDTSAGRYIENVDRSGAAGFQIYSNESYLLRYKSEFQFFTNTARVYYTTDGSNPSGSLGAPVGTTQVLNASYTYVYSDQTQACQIVDVLTATIPTQAAGKTVKYILSTYHSGIGIEVFANSGTCTGCFSCTNSTTGCATIFQYTVLAAPTAASVSVSGRVTTALGRGISNVQITLFDSQGKERTVTTTSFGYYRFDDVMAGETITISAKARRVRFIQPSIVRTTNESVSNADFISEQ